MARTENVRMRVDPLLKRAVENVAGRERMTGGLSELTRQLWMADERIRAELARLQGKKGGRT